MPEPTLDPVNSLLTEFSTRLNEMEEKQRLLRDRALLIGENLIGTKEEIDNLDFETQKQIKEINEEIKNLKQLSNRIINEMGNFARKTEVDIMKRQFQMFSPLEIVTKKEVEELVKKIISKK